MLDFKNKNSLKKSQFKKDDAKQSQYLALSIVYFISVLMVSRYRDIIEANNNVNSNSHQQVTNTPFVNSVRDKQRHLNDSLSLNTNSKS